MTQAPSIAVLLPCYNEENTITQTINSFSSSLPDAHIYVCDNNSTDNTSRVAQEAGATVLVEKRQGKGHAVRKLMSRVDADIYILSDGDNTYDASSAPQLVKLLEEQKLDMVVATRMESYANTDHRKGHTFGNRLITLLVNFLFKSGFTDILSGYRVMSRQFVKSIPLTIEGFELETYFTVHAMEIHAAVEEVETPYKNRGDESDSKLNTFRDGFRIMKTIFYLFKDNKPLYFFSILSLVLLLLGLALGIPVITEFLETGLVPRFPTAILATGIVLSSILSMVCGLILDTVANTKREIKMLHYLSWSKEE